MSKSFDRLESQSRSNRPSSLDIEKHPIIEALVRDTLEWTQVQRDLAHLIELQYSFLNSTLNCPGGVGRELVSEFLHKLAEMPEGWRIATLLRDVDQQWGHKLECKGIEFDTIIRQQEKGA